LIASRQFTVYVEQLEQVVREAFVWVTEGMRMELKKKKGHRQLLVDGLAGGPDELVRTKVPLTLQLLQEAPALATTIKDESLLRRIGRQAMPTWQRNVPHNSRDAQ
jgi:hypothetical protein